MSQLSLGAEEFMRAMNPADYQITENMKPFSSSSNTPIFQSPKVNSPRKSTTTLSNRTPKSFSNSPISHPSPLSIIPQLNLKGESPIVYAKKKLSKEKCVSRRMFESPAQCSNKDSPIQVPSSSYDGGTASKSTTAKLELFIVCRFEKLSSEDQNVIRTASIIGSEFSRDVLYGILSPRLRTQMFNSLYSLVKNQWITDSIKNSLSEYSFVHPLLYQTLYDLTPAGDKARLHFAVAIYIEESYEGNADHFEQLGHHYGLAKDCGSKALEYYVRAAVHNMSNGPLFYDQGLDLLSKAMAFTESAMDYGAILGIVMDRKDKLMNSRKELMEDEQKALLPQLIKIPTRRYFLNLKTVVPLNTVWESGDDEDSGYKKGNLTIKGTDGFLESFQDMEDILEIHYKRVVEENKVGTTQPWQIPHLTKRKELELKISTREEIRKGLEITFDKSNRRSLLFGENSSKNIINVTNSFEPNSPNVVFVSSKMNRNVCEIS